MDDYFLTRFKSLIEQRLLKQAVCFASAFTNKFPNVGLYHESLGYAYWTLDEFENARNCLARAQLCGDVSLNGLILLLRLALQAGKRKQSRAVLSELLQNHGLTRTQKEGLASNLGGLREYGAALQVCQHLARAYPDSADAWYGIGFYQERLGCSPLVCVKAFREAFKLSGCVCSRVHLAKVLAQLEWWDEAYALVRVIPISHLNRIGWAQSVFQIAIAKQDFALADAIRSKYSCDFQCLSEYK